MAGESGAVGNLRSVPWILSLMTVRCFAVVGYGRVAPFSDAAFAVVDVVAAVAVAAAAVVAAVVVVVVVVAAAVAAVALTECLAADLPFFVAHMILFVIQEALFVFVVVVVVAVVLLACLVYIVSSVPLSHFCLPLRKCLYFLIFLRLC